MTEEITRLPVKFKTPPSEERTLEVVRSGGPGEACNHSFYFAGNAMRHVTYVVDPAAAEVECGHCHAKLNPQWVLTRLAHNETLYLETQKRYQEEMGRLHERSRTKCDHCGKMTRVSRR